MTSLVERALSLDKFSIAKIISTIESSSADDSQDCVELERALMRAKNTLGRIIGITGAPGVGKSTLINALVNEILRRDRAISVAVVAVDPSSAVSKGSLLGDRTRVQFSDEARTYFRSQASDLDLGGIGKTTFRVCRLLATIFDIIVVESVGVGQSEIEIARLADLTLLALQPLSGDQIQFMKSGIMEIPQGFVITKCDAEELAQKSYHQLVASLEFSRVVDMNTKGNHVSHRIFMTSAMNQQGFSELAEFVLDTKLLLSAQAEAREAYFIEKEIRHEWGEWGLKAFRKTSHKNTRSFEERRREVFIALPTLIREELNKL